MLFKDNIDISARNKTDTNKLILEILGINKNIFLDSVFLSQTVSTNLASLSPTQRKERLEILTNTDQVINTFKENLKGQQNLYESKCVETQLEINKIEGKQETIENQKQNLLIQINNINRQIEERNQLGNIEDLNKQIQEYNVEINTINNQIPGLDNQIEMISKSINELKNEQKIYEEKRVNKD